MKGITSVGMLIGDPSAETRSAISMSFSLHVSPNIDIKSSPTSCDRALKAYN
ncbi:hypothetical protein [Mesorhizobium sp. M1300]|uniref:hypothetical protein n=1 Tax=Mesorhizobium sp. M1300 TaxID=2957077 RepID=UPI00333AEF57